MRKIKLKAQGGQVTGEVGIYGSPDFVTPRYFDAATEQTLVAIYRKSNARPDEYIHTGETLNYETFIYLTEGKRNER